jgi:lipopolysaccharide/colanic/teichoic acid biosynthesis glycosyltransferase
MYKERAVRLSLRLAIKRGTDLTVSFALLILGIPIFALIAIAVLVETRGPVLFRQERAGLHGKPFRIYKVRSMALEAESGGPVMSMSDPRVTRVGQFLRRFSLDELPQVLNVIRGEMSLVGPRPLLVGTTRKHEERRLDMRPGMTSLVEVSQPHLLSWDQRMQIDIDYVDRWSLSLDIGILFRTIPVLLSRKDILDLPRECDPSEVSSCQGDR